MDAMINELEAEHMKKEVPEFDIGDTIRVSTKIIEGEKERIQVFQGTVIARKGRGLNETFSVHRVSYGEGMERVFSLHSPRISAIEVVKKGDVRRAKLYNLRGKTGKAAKVKEKIGGRSKKKQADSETSKVEENAQVEPDVNTNDSAPAEEQQPAESTTQE